MEHQRILRQPFLDRWQLAPGHQAGQHRGLPETAGLAVRAQDDRGPLRGLLGNQIGRGTGDFRLESRLAAEGTEG